MSLTAIVILISISLATGFFAECFFIRCAHIKEATEASFLAAIKITAIVFLHFLSFLFVSAIVLYVLFTIASHC